ncbi:MAG: DUF4097 domain-containing protein [Melioribacter sp.]|nr:DUF4097 domain-containing protein [Melioribacter sp.]
MIGLKRKHELIFLLTLCSFITITSVSKAEEKRVLREKTFIVTSERNLFINASSADVEVKSWNKNEAQIKIYGNKSSEDKMFFEIEEKENGIYVIVKRKNSSIFSFWRPLDITIEAVIPEKFNIKVETSGGDVLLKDLNGEQYIYTSGGDIRLKSVYGEIIARTSGGDISLSNSSGKLNVSTSGGAIICELVKGDLKASTSGGDITIHSLGGKILANTSGGDIKILLEKDFNGIEVETSGGDIELQLPSDIKANADISTYGGEIECNFSNMKSKKLTKSSLIAELNGGGEKLRAKTSGGDIILKEK